MLPLTFQLLVGSVRNRFIEFSVFDYGSLPYLLSLFFRSGVTLRLVALDKKKSIKERTTDSVYESSITTNKQEMTFLLYNSLTKIYPLTLKLKTAIVNENLNAHSVSPINFHFLIGFSSKFLLENKSCM